MKKINSLCRNAYLRLKQSVKVSLFVVLGLIFMSQFNHAYGVNIVPDAFKDIAKYQCPAVVDMFTDGNKNYHDGYRWQDWALKSDFNSGETDGLKYPTMLTKVHVSDGSWHLSCWGQQGETNFQIETVSRPFERCAITDDNSFICYTPL